MKAGSSSNISLEIEMASLSKAKELQDRLECGLARDLGFKIREGDIVLGNFEDLEVGSTVDQKAGKQNIRKVRISGCKSNASMHHVNCRSKHELIPSIPRSPSGGRPRRPASG